MIKPKKKKDLSAYFCPAKILTNQQGYMGKQTL
jgi:hypothetical protein